MPLMGSLYIGASGLQTSQNALNTTAHNLSNVDTTGYTRQQVQQSELENLCNRIFAGSSKDFILSFISRESVSEEELAELKAAVQEYHR